ncbi:MAG: hypothetical protein ABSA11_02005 [Candidatus Bathyarchaeia archaeon]|jgi:hypothetical protein
MSTNSNTTLTVLISIILATSAFLAVAISQPVPQIKVSEEQAISILREYDNTDNRIVNGTIRTLSANLEYISLNWTTYLSNTGDEPHSRIYISDTPVGEYKPYWFIHIESVWDYGWSGGSGSYIVDAQSGEIVLSLERVGGGISVIGPDYLIFLQPEAWDYNNPVEAKLGAFTPITLTLTAEPDYHASLPVSMKIANVPLGYCVGPSNSSAVLKTGGYVSFILEVFTPVAYPADFLPPPADPHPHFDVGISFLGHSYSYPVYIIPSNK